MAIIPLERKWRFVVVLEGGRPGVAIVTNPRSRAPVVLFPKEATREDAQALAEQLEREIRDVLIRPA